MNSVDMSTKKSASATRLKKAAAHHLRLVAGGAPCSTRRKCYTQQKCYKQLVRPEALAKELCLRPPL